MQQRTMIAVCDTCLYLTLTDLAGLQFIADDLSTITDYEVVRAIKRTMIRTMVFKTALSCVKSSLHDVDQKTHAVEILLQRML